MGVELVTVLLPLKSCLFVHPSVSVCSVDMLWTYPLMSSQGLVFIFEAPRGTESSVLVLVVSPKSLSSFSFLGPKSLALS